MDRRLALGAALMLVAAACRPSAVIPTVSVTAPTADVVPVATAQAAATPTASLPAAAASEAPVDLPMTGSILFQRYDDDSVAQLWVACADLSEARRVPTPDGLSAGWGTWSPDGRRIVFNAGHDDPDVNDRSEPWDVYGVAPDGSGLRQLTRATALLGDPDYSPDGTLIAYDSWETGGKGIWLMDAADGGHPRQVVSLPEGSLQDAIPRFSPDGLQLVFTRWETEVTSGLWIVNVDGTGLRALPTPGVEPGIPAWSPDGTRIAFEGTREGSSTHGDIWVVHPDGSGLANLTRRADSGREGFSEPAWSPDGSMIMTNHGLHPGPSQLGLAVMRADGTGLRWVTDGTGFEHHPSWTDVPC